MCASRLAVSALAALAKDPQHRLRHVVLDLARDDAKANRVMCALSYFDLKNDALA